MGDSVTEKSDRGNSGWGRALSIVLAIAVLGSFGVLGYVITVSRATERFTEFYLLNSSGKANDYPGLLRVGEEGRVIVGIVNREYETMTYRLEVRIEGSITNEAGQVTLEHGGKWEEIVSFTPQRVGDNEKVEFLLYRQGQEEAYRSLYLLVDVQ